jgi:hypothetical protein
LEQQQQEQPQELQQQQQQQQQQQESIHNSKEAVLPVRGQAVPRQ